MNTHHTAVPVALKRTRITVDNDTAELIKALRAKGINANEVLRRGLRRASKDIAGTAGALERARAKRSQAKIFTPRCGDIRGTAKPRC